MHLKLFTSVMNVTMHRVCRAAKRPRADFRLEVQSDPDAVRTLSVLCDGVVRLYPVGNNTQWARALLNDAIDGCFADEAAGDPDDADTAVEAGGEPLALPVHSKQRPATAQGKQEAVPAETAFFERFADAVKWFAERGNVLSVAQAGPLCTALRQARESDLFRARQQLDRALDAPGLDGDSLLCEPALELDFVTRQFERLRSSYAAPADAQGAGYANSRLLRSAANDSSQSNVSVS
jgi:hypothetical protein